MTKEIKVEFAPGCFDNFEGTQEELDKLVADLQEMFTNKSAEELEAMSKPLTEEDWEELPDDVKEQLSRSYLSDDQDLEDKFKRKLQ